MLNIMQVLRENIPHPEDMDFLLYLTARNHPSNDDFIENVLIKEMEQDLVFRNNFRLCVIEGGKIILYFKSELFTHGLRLKNVIEQSMKRVYRGLSLSDIPWFPYNKKPEKTADIEYDIGSRYFDGFIRLTIQGDPSPIQYFDGKLEKEQREIEEDLFQKAKADTSCDVGLSDIGEDYKHLLSELDDTTKKIDKEMNDLVKRKNKIQSMIGAITRGEMELRDKVALDYMRKTGELNEQTAKIDRQRRFYQL